MPSSPTSPPTSASSASSPLCATPRAAFLIKFDREVELLQDITSSRRELESARELLETPAPVRVMSRRRPGGPSLGGRVAGTALYDALLLSSEEMMMKQTGRKALILISDGIDMGSKVSLDSSVKAAHRADSLVYPIRFYDEDAYRAAAAYASLRNATASPSPPAPATLPPPKTPAPA
ncbi:MAG: hypothetical protein FJW20_09245 [Acidimicrobiia bacterium]|nr:hypothetical protein [Acidimicrobiia bacterium]